MAEKVGVATGGKTKADRPVYKTPEGEMVSEKSLTIPMGGKFINVPSIHDGVQYSEDEIIDMLKENKIEATSVHDSMEEAIEAAKSRSSKLLAKGGSMESQMDIFEEGGLKDEGGTIDPVSGNDVPPGSTQSEVRDDIPAQLSEGEFVFPADVVRYIGLENLMKLRQKAKMGLQKMEDMGQMGNSEEATMSDDGEFDAGVESMIEDMPMDRQMAQGGAVMSVEQEMMQKQRRGYAMGGAVMSVEQEMMQKNRQSFAPGGMPRSNLLTPSQNIAPKVPTYAQFMGSPARALGVKYASEQYIGPNGDIITVTTTNGRPNQPIPDGYRKYNPAVEAPKAPEVAKPKVEQNQEDSSDDRERSEARKKAYADSLTEINKLSELSPEFKEWAEKNIPGQVKAAKAMTIDPLTGEISFPGLSLAEQVKGVFSGEKLAVLTAALAELGGTGPYGKAYSDLAKSAGIDLGKYNLNNISAKLGLLEDVKNTIADPNFEAKREERSRLERDRGDYEVSGLTKEQVDAQIAEDLDEIADAIDRGEIGDNGPKRVSVEVTSDTPSGPPGGSTASEDPSDEDSTGARGSKSGTATTDTEGSFNKGGAVKTKRKKGLGRLK